MKKNSYIISCLTIALMSITAIHLSAMPAKPGTGLKEPIRPTITDARYQNHYVNGSHRIHRAIGDRNFAERGLVILVQWDGTSFKSSNKPADFDSLMNGQNYTYGGATGSVRKYFMDQSMDQYKPHFDVVGPVTMPHSYSWYGQNKDGNDRYLADFVIDACNLADTVLGVDFSQYDCDEDGVVDFIYFIYAGKGEADGGGDNTIWPHNWDLISALAYNYSYQTTYYYNSYSDCNLPTYDGYYVNNYACSNELDGYSSARNGMATIAHEFSHVLGLPDLYDTGYSTNYYSGYTPGAWDIMDMGSYNNDGNTPPNYSVYEKYYLGWAEPEMLRAKTVGGQTYSSYADTLPADGQTYRMATFNCLTSLDKSERTDTAYYFENRQKSGWDSYILGHGMLVWRVIYDADVWSENAPNCEANKPRCTLICAGGGKDVSNTYYGNRQDVPFPGEDNVTTYKPYGNRVKLTNIKESNNLITFNFSTDYTPGADPIEQYFIRNNWGGNVTYTWEEMTPANDNRSYTHTGIFGTKGVHISPTADLADAIFYATDDTKEYFLLGDSIAKGDTVLFTYDKVLKTTTATLIGRPYVPKGLDDISGYDEADVEKVLLKGQIYIRRKDGLYTITGQRVQ